MSKINIKNTQNPAIIKFEFPDFIAGTDNYEFKNIDEASASPLAQQLFYLPFVKTVYISGNFIAIERYNIVEWEDVQEAVAEQIEEYFNSGKLIVAPKEHAAKKAVEVYGEITPNPSALKFVASILLTRIPVEYKNIDQAASSPLAKQLFNFPYVREIFIDENYVSITKYDSYEWNDITQELRSFIKNYIQNGGPVIDESLIQTNSIKEEQKERDFDNLDPVSQRIINILEEYVKPAVAADGGNIVFDSYDETDKRVKVVLQGACNGCPSSTFTLKSGIENMLKDMLKDDDIKVEALNA
ncbi:MAG TPA: NifU family protein [Flavobacterium sp.]|jgi:Fe-S cluster biogenesis protein NfuA